MDIKPTTIIVLSQLRLLNDLLRHKLIHFIYLFIIKYSHNLQQKRSKIQ